MKDLTLAYRIRIQENEFGAAAENPFAIKTMSEIFAELSDGKQSLPTQTRTGWIDSEYVSCGKINILSVILLTISANNSIP